MARPAVFAGDLPLLDPEQQREDPPNRLGEGGRGVLHPRRRRCEAAVPGIATAHPSHADATQPPGHHNGDGDEEHRHQRRAVAGRFKRIRHQPEPASAARVGQSAAEELPRHRVDQTDDQGRKQTQQDTEYGQQTLPGADPPRPGPRTTHMPTACLTEKGDAVDLHEGRRHQCACERQHGGRDRDEAAHDAAVEPPGLQGGLKGQPFGDEAVERRQCRDRQTADQEEEPGPRHAPQQTAHLLQVPLVGAVQDGACAQKEQPLEECMIKRVIERGDKGERARQRMAGIDEDQRQAQSDEDDAQILDR